MPAFEPKPDHELERLSDEALIAYIVDARDTRHDVEVTRGLSQLVGGHWPNVERRVRMKVPPEHVEDLTGTIIVSAIASTFNGTSMGEFVNWLATITRYRIADFYGKAEKAPDRVSLDAGDDDEGPGLQLEAVSQEGYTELQDVIEQVLATLSEAHQRVIELRIFQDLPSLEVARRLGLTDDNVDQIASRFRRKLRKMLGDDGDTST